MSVLVVLGIAVLGGAGAIGRFLLDGAVAARAGRAFPWGTLAVNLSGAFVLGVLTGAALSGDALRLLGTGFCGAFTTFSTFQVELLGMLDADRAGLALGYAGASLLAGGIAVALASNLVRRAA